MKTSHIIGLLPVALALSACDAVVLHPSGDVAIQERNLLFVATGLMLLIIIPVIILTVLFAWRYRKSNAAARYEPEWNHSIQLELMIWSVPLLIIIWLGALTWMGSHLLDPYRPTDRIAADRPLDKDIKPLEIDVVALDWKWLFIYPEYQLATVNEIAAPVDRPIDFHITSATVMNSFYIPALAGQIYAMAGMETKLYAVINKPGDYRGFSANFSGDGFSGMHFIFKGLSGSDFDNWVMAVKHAPDALTRARYEGLSQPSSNNPPLQFATVENDLFRAIVFDCVSPGQVCSAMSSEKTMPTTMPMTMPMPDPTVKPMTMPMPNAPYEAKTPELKAPKLTPAPVPEAMRVRMSDMKTMPSPQMPQEDSHVR